MTTKRIIWICAFGGYLFGELTGRLAKMVSNGVLSWSINIGSIVVGSLVAYAFGYHFDKKEKSNS
ncbi:hypothetical protein FD51_GL001591 [Lacticaseibacillus zeae DSM 20178 = KCTC 3804]|uniref:Uncharacterized protein n=1 Tax=Lacticaseibacillus zeae DSM 20178 = KCTC 3804 TaxID=1423816 RepID=A0A0R1F1F7_LACZE|nr:hypothetical protein FD51_GL001591 [Lacticaseibacillus zeae DSM 20178 = KCTC 3804]